MIITYRLVTKRLGRLELFLARRAVWPYFDIDKTPRQRLRINSAGQKNKPFARRDGEASTSQILYLHTQGHRHASSCLD